MASFDRRGDQQWRVRINRKGHRLTRTFAYKDDAQRWARQVEGDIDRGIFVDHTEAESTTLAELLARYGKEITPKKKGWRQELSRIKTIGNHPIAKKAVAAISGKDIAGYRDARLKKVGNKTARDDLILLGHLFKIAIQEWGIALPHGNPVASVRKPPDSNRRDRRLQGDEEQRLMKACHEYGHSLPAIVQLALETGMRRGEIAGLGWEDVKLNHRVIHLSETKNGESRDVPLSSRAVAVLQSIPRRIDGQVFGMRADSFTQAFSRACARAGIEDLRFHDLRHEATSRFFELGLNPMQVAAITGHKTLEMLKRYTHLRAEDLAAMLG